MTSYRTLCNRCERYALIGHAYRRWYRVARAVVRRLSDHRHDQLTPHVFEYPEAAYLRLCDLVAITSPRCSVKRNLRFAWGEYIGERRPGDMIRSTRVALDHYWRTGEIRGAKTSRFARVLRGDDSVVVVDTWMARALGVPDKQARNKSTQELAERVIDRVQDRIVFHDALSCGRLTSFGYSGWWPMAEVQAVVWAGMIRTHYKDGKVPIMRVDDVLGKVSF